MAGFSIGGLIFPPIVQYFFNTYGFRGAFLLAGGVVFNATVGTLLQRIPAPQQPPATTNKGARVKHEKMQHLRATETQQRISDTYSTPASPGEKIFPAIEISVVHEKNYNKTKSPQAGGVSNQNNWKSAVENEGFDADGCNNGSSSVKNVRAVACRGRFLSVDGSASTVRVIHETRKRAMSTTETTVPIRCILLSECLAWKERAVNNCEPFHLHAHKTAETGAKERFYHEFSSTADELCASKTARKSSMDVKPKLQELKELFSFLAHARYYAIVLTKVVIVTNSTIFTTVIIDFALDHGIERWRALTLITAYTAMDLTARLSAGWITDRKFMSRSTWMASCLALWTAADFCFAYGDSYATLLGVSAVAGWCNGSTLPLVPVLYMEVVDIGRFSVAYGLSSFTAGITGLLRPTLTGLFRDKLGDYSGLFLLTGTCTALSTIRWICASLQEKCSRNPGK
ncbi:hypothetical protein V5799_031528 [Amblyomma americanum]|uniref:Monocarboxylate transporter n=1 Tax=Amblyomma americanum TaxID=6943 RepID=A0AAQ4EJZ5_AMBAM